MSRDLAIVEADGKRSGSVSFPGRLTPHSRRPLHPQIAPVKGGPIVQSLKLLK